jgi:hypothetical protein
VSFLCRNSGVQQVFDFLGEKKSRSPAKDAVSFKFSKDCYVCLVSGWLHGNIFTFKVKIHAYIKQYIIGNLQEIYFTEYRQGANVYIQ